MSNWSLKSLLMSVQARHDGITKIAGALQSVDPQESMLRQLAGSPHDVVLSHFQSCLEGLTDAESLTRLLVEGKNVLSSKKPVPWWKQLLLILPNPFNILLGLLAIISVAAPPPTWSTFTVLIIMIVISTGVRFWQEYKTNIAAIKLQSSITTQVQVRRQVGVSEKPEHRGQSINLEDLVPGDILSLNPGDSVPADCLLLETSHLQIAQASLTGESEPTTKTSSVNIDCKDVALFDLDNIAFLGTSVISGTATAIVIATGDRTLIASITRQLSQKQPLNTFERGVRNVSYLMIGFMIAMVSMVLVINGELSKNWGQAALFSVSVAVGAVPEMLPAIVNGNLARGAYLLSNKGALVKRLDAVQNLGVMTVLCSDKTGTLTKDEISLDQYQDAEGHSSDRVLQLAYTNALYQSGKKNSIDAAIIKRQAALGEVGLPPLGEHIDEIPFDFEKRRSSAIMKTTNGILLICKGAFEEMMSLSSHVRRGGDVVPLDAATRNQVAARATLLNEDGYRALLVATRVLQQKELDCRNGRLALDTCMVLEGLLTFSDPPKDDAAASVAELHRLGVEVKVLTGDNLRIATKVCHDLNLQGQDIEQGLQSITGPELSKLTTDDFHASVKNCTIFAKLTPAQKGEIIMSLRNSGQSVGMLVDGINDCVALRSADVGISVDSAVNVAKDCANVILTKKELSIIVSGVKNGRITHGNTIKYIKMVASSNVGNVISILIASAWLPYQPMSPLQILLQNLLYDLSQVALPWDHMDEEYLLEPQKWDTWDLLRFILVLAPTSSTIDMCTFSLDWFYYGIRTVDSPLIKMARTHWFLEGLFTQTLIVHLLRSAKVPFFQSWASVPLIVSTTAMVTVGLVLPYIHAIGHALGFVHPAGTFLGFLAAEIVVYCVEVQVVKMIYIRVFKRWL